MGRDHPPPRRARLSLRVRLRLAATIPAGLALVLTGCDAVTGVASTQEPTVSVASGAAGSAGSAAAGAGLVSRSGEVLHHPGEGSFWYDDPVLAQPIEVWCSVPEQARAARVLVVMPGAQRNAGDYLTDWTSTALARSTLVLVPQLPSDEFPDDVYNLGGVVDASGEDTDPATWTYTFVERLFEQVRLVSGTTATRYDLFGHSAGAQFVHRFVELGTHPHLGHAIAANAGWYLMPDDDVDFPYGLDRIPPDEADLGPAFGSHLTVLLGADDVDEDDDLLRHDEGSDAQGSTRLERGLSFYLQAREAAQAEDLAFTWDLRTVPDVAHDHTAMAAAAAGLLASEQAGATDAARPGSDPQLPQPR